MGIRSWLREKWNSMLPGQAYILDMYNTPMSGLPVPCGKEYSYKLNSRAPYSEGGWITRWQWLTFPLPGVTLDHPDSTYTVVRIAANAPPGFGRIEVVYIRQLDGFEVHSKPLFINIFQPAVQTNAGT